MKAAIRAVKNSVYQFEEIEVQVREATSSDRWGVTDSAMSDIARATNDYNAYPKLFAMLWKRLTDVEHVMHVQKALILVEYLLRYGSERFITDAKRRSRDIAALQKYKHYDENNQDDAKEARAKAKIVTDLLSDERRLAEERSKAQKMKENMRGFGSNDYAGGGPSYRDPVGSSYGNNAYGNGSYDDEHRDTPAQREAPRQSFDEDPYGESKSKSAVPKTEEDDEAERKRKKKEKKREKEAKEAAAAASAASASSSSAHAEDPFSSSVIPSSVGSGGAAEAPASEEKKKKKKKDKSADKGAEAPAAASAASHYAAVAASPARSADVDLTSFADSGSNRGGGGGASGGSGDFDFLSGNQHHGGQDLSSMFGATSISSQPTLWDQPAEDNNEEEFGFSSNSGAAAASHSSASAAQTTPPKQKADIWSSDLFNLERLDQNPAQANKKANVVEGGVSMSMMKNLNPNAVPTPKRGGSSGSFNFGAPAAAGPGPAGPSANNAFAHTGGFAAPGAFGQAPPPPLGPSMQMGYGQPGLRQPGYGAPYGQPQGYPQQPYGAPYGAAPMGYPQQGYGAPPMSYGGGMGMMPQGGAGGFPGAGPQGAPFGAPQQQRPAQQSLDPFASLTPGLSSKPNANKSMDFFVPAARK